MRTILINLYEFAELAENVQGKVLNNLRTLNVDSNWWEPTYDDARNIGLIITSFDLDQNRHAVGKFNTGAKEVAAKIMTEHGMDCDTYNGRHF